MNIVKIQGDIEKRQGVYYEYDTDSIPLGEGGMGRVFKGFRVLERTGERTPVAIKAIYDNIPERVVERARREADIQIEHENLIRMYSFVETKDKVGDSDEFCIHYHVIMELLVGVTLENVINGVTTDPSGFPIPFAAELSNQLNTNRYEAVVKVSKSILSGLMVLHDKGYIHRDIDPSNIMITIDGKVKLIDFGICKQIVSLGSVDKTLTTTGVFMGKVNYAAPELVLGDVKNQNYTTDIYALGILIFQLCTGHLPFSGTDQDILSAHLKKNLPLKEISNKGFRRIIAKATEKAQSKRYSSVAELRVDLEHVPLVKSNSNRKPFMYIGIIAVLALIVFGVWHYSESKPSEQTVSILPEQEQPTCSELYAEAMALLSHRDSIQCQTQAKEILQHLVVDSLYEPARLDYYILMLNSTVPDEVRTGFNGVHGMIEKDSLCSGAMFEYGLTLSKSNRYFSVPAMRQSLIDLDPDLKEANVWLRKSMGLDSRNYKAVYWLFNNMMEINIDENSRGKNNPKSEREIVRLYRLFNERIKDVEDPALSLYKKAIEGDKVTLQAWGLL